MQDLFFLFLPFIIYLDLRFFKEYDPFLFRRIFCSSKGILISFLFILAFIFFFTAQKLANVSIFILISFFPWYLLKRDQLIKSSPLKEERSSLVWYEDALGVILWWVFITFTIVFVFKRISIFFFNPWPELMSLMLVTFLSLLIMMALICRASKKFSDADFLTNVGARRQGRPLGKIVFIPALLGLLFAYLSANIIVTRQIQPVTPLSEVLESTSSLPAIFFFIILAVIFAPFLEEIIFRGYFYHVLKERKGAVFAIYMIALSFGFLHVDQYQGDWLAVGMVMTLGFVLTLLRAWTGSTLPGIVTHYVYNAGVMVLTFILLMLANPSYVEYKMNADSYSFTVKERLLLQSIHKKPEFTDAYNDLAELYARENVNLQRALELIDQALKLYPDHQPYLDTKAKILFKLGRDHEALNQHRPNERDRSRCF